ncbi:hypothetical protein BKA93DRAFT_729354 [Sparassis latifolia]
MFSRRACTTLLVLCAVNVLIDIFFIQTSKRITPSRGRPLDHYSLIEDDYPAHLPLPSSFPLLHLSVEESVRFAVSTPESELEWLWTGPGGYGEIHLGRDRHYFAVAFIHQVHCLRFIRMVLQRDGVSEGGVRGHVTHCMNYLRQSTLCGADSTLEPADVLTRNYSGPIERVGAEYVCTNWPAVYRVMEGNWVDFLSSRG